MHEYVAGGVAGRCRPINIINVNSLSRDVSLSVAIAARSFLPSFLLSFRVAKSNAILMSRVSPINACDAGIMNACCTSCALARNCAPRYCEISTIRTREDSAEKGVRSEKSLSLKVRILWFSRFHFGVSRIYDLSRGRSRISQRANLCLSHFSQAHFSFFSFGGRTASRKNYKKWNKTKRARAFARERDD